MIGARQPQPAADRASSGPGWLRVGSLVALGELILLGLMVFHPRTALGATERTDPLATSGGHAHHVTHRDHSVPSRPKGTLSAIPSPTPPTSVTSTTTALAVWPTPTTPPATPARVAPAVGVLAANIAPQPDFLQSCSGSRYDDSLTCVAATLQAIANGRSHEGIAPMVLPTNWSQLPPDQQIFVATNLERTARGLTPLTAMATVLDQAARQGAAQSVDPGPPGGFPSSQWGSNWAGAVGNPLEAIYFWMYDDGGDSANIDCTSSNQSGCWGHRENILLRLPCTVCLMGTAWEAQGYRGAPSLTELLVESWGNPSLDFTWQQESVYLP